MEESSDSEEEPEKAKKSGKGTEPEEEERLGVGGKLKALPRGVRRKKSLRRCLAVSGQIGVSKLMCGGGERGSQI